MASDAAIRPLLAADVPAADRVTWAALSPLWPEDVRPVDDDIREARGRARIAHVLHTDPGGCWVAEAGGAVVGVALALIREGVWGFSLFGLLDEHRGRGAGAALFAAALSYGDGAHGGIILSSEHPAAMRMYALAGFALRPSVSVAGMLDRRALPDGLRARPGALEDEADVATCRTASRFVRGASHERDLQACLEAGGELLVVPGRGFAMHRGGSVFLLAALDENTACDLLWSAFAAAQPGATVHVDFITAGND